MPVLLLQMPTHFKGSLCDHQQPTKQPTAQLCKKKKKKGLKQALLPGETQILQCVQQDGGNLLPVCHGQCPVFLSGLLEEQHLGH